jgi:hypothetical protein
MKKLGSNNHTIPNDAVGVKVLGTAASVAVSGPGWDTFTESTSSSDQVVQVDRSGRGRSPTPKPMNFHPDTPPVIHTTSLTHTTTSSATSTIVESSLQCSSGTLACSSPVAGSNRLFQSRGPSFTSRPRMFQSSSPTRASPTPRTRRPQAPSSNRAWNVLLQGNLACSSAGRNRMFLSPERLFASRPRMFLSPGRLFASRPRMFISPGPLFVVPGSR